MKPLLFFLVCALSLASGAAALMYEVCWFRSLGLVLGGTQLAVTTTVSVFMCGLALGNWLAARHIYRYRKLFLVYGLLELGIGLFAGVFQALMKVYPQIYTHLAGLAPESLIYLTCIRVIFAVAAMAVPTTFMGATIPVLTAALSSSVSSVARNVSFLYALNTFGAVVGAAVSGFYLLRFFPVSSVTLMAAAVNFTIGLIGIGLTGQCALSPADSRAAAAQKNLSQGGRTCDSSVNASASTASQLASRLVLWGIGISGFCALGYEVLWTRILILFFDATVYSFTVILIAFLFGMGLGSSSYGIFEKIIGPKRDGSVVSSASRAVAFGTIQVLIGVSTVFIMRLLPDLPAYSIFIQHFFFRTTHELFLSRQLGKLILSSAYLIVPAFFMGLSIPLASRVYAGWKKTTGKAVGELLAYNTVGAILGAAMSGFVFLYFIGIERSIQVLCLINIGVGLVIIARARGQKRLAAGTGAVFLLFAAFLFLNDTMFKSWNLKYLATYTPDRALSYSDAAKTRQQLEAYDVLYYGEGSESIVSSTQNRETGALQFSVNGRPEASTNLEDVQNQYMLGHLPMLLHRNPKKALVIGAGSGMTLAAVFSHPGVEELHLVEIEPKVLGVARAFGEFNHRIVDHPDLEIFYDDARNYLLASRMKYDVITADPIHPTWRGSGYLYTSEYFRLAAERLSPGGIMCQWLPLYLLSGENVKSVVNTFRQQFRYVMIWLTMADVQLVGSNEPIVIDRTKIERRLKEPSVSEDLKAVFMGSSDDLFGYFLMGDRGTAAFAGGATINRDDNVYLEFSSPANIGVNYLEAGNLKALHVYREDIEAYTTQPEADRAGPQRANEYVEIASMNDAADRAQIVYLAGDKDPKALKAIQAELGRLPRSGRLQSLRAGLFGY